MGKGLDLDWLLRGAVVARCGDMEGQRWWNGISEDALVAFGRGKCVTRVNGLHLYEMLDWEIPLTRFLERKVGGAAKTGTPILLFRNLLPH